MKIPFKDSFICEDSRLCEKGCYFLSYAANAAHKDKAIAKGALILSEKAAKDLLGIKDDIKIIAVVGTNGKTTTAGAIYSMLLDLGKKAFLCGTRGAFCNDEEIAPKSLTTPFLLEFLTYLQVASQKGCEFLICELSSHAIAQGRLGGAKFAAKIYTNLSQDHLDYHKTFEAYAAVKASFFQDESLKFINKDAYSFAYNVKSSFTYGIENPSYYHVNAYSLTNGIEAAISYGRSELSLSSPLLGLFNLYNLLAAIACVNELVRPKREDLEEAISNFAGITGRMQEVAPNVIVDFAHTPDGVEKVLDSMKYKKLIVLLGCGGNRDKGKRPLMAKTAARFAKFLILSSDNPRDEDPMSIIKDMQEGLSSMSNVFIEPERRAAIKLGLELLAKEKDAYLLVLGKGDEPYMEIKGKKLPYSDTDCIKELLKR